MKTRRSFRAFIFFIWITLIFLMACSPASAAFYYKSYVVRYDRGWNILCEPYIVQKDDWVFKLFRQKGEISHSDFPEFLRIFARLNPHIQNIDHIRPGQHILIPLKKVDEDILSEESSGVVTIPYFSAKDLPETNPKEATSYRIKSGDCVSVLIANRYGKYGTESYQAGEELFRKLNPQIKNLNLIYAGQKIRLPNPHTDIPSPSRSSDDSAVPHETPASEGSVAVSDTKTSPASVQKVGEKPTDSTLSDVASILDATLFNKGSYYLPRHGQEDFKIDLSRTPFIKLDNDTRIFFFKNDDNPEPAMKTIKTFWKDARVVTIAPGDSTGKILAAVFGKFESGVLKRRLNFSDHGVDVEVRGKWIIEKSRAMGEPERYLCISLIHNGEEQTPEPIVRYLDQNNIVIKDIIMGKNHGPPKEKAFPLINVGGPLDVVVNADRKTFVKNLLVAVGCRYIPDKPITFQYAGVQIQGASNLVSGKDGKTFLIDFGDFYGDAVQAIEKSGYSIIQIKDNDTLDDIIQKLFSAMNVSYTKNPAFLAAKRPAADNTKLTIQGFLTEHQDTPATLISLAPLNHEVIRYLTDNNIRIIRIKFQGKKNE